MIRGTAAIPSWSRCPIACYIGRPIAQQRSLFNQQSHMRFLPNLTRLFATTPSNSGISSKPTDMSAPTPNSIQKSDDEWRTILSKEQFKILRQKGTEAAGTGEYNKHTGDGTYACAACGTPLYTSTTKFSSGCGWPAFFDAIPGAVTRHTDRTFGISRTEIVCTACGGHLGHVFKGEGFNTPTDERHCVNSVSLKFHDEDVPKKA